MHDVAAPAEVTPAKPATVLPLAPSLSPSSSPLKKKKKPNTHKKKCVCDEEWCNELQREHYLAFCFFKIPQARASAFVSVRVVCDLIASTTLELSEFLFSCVCSGAGLVLQSLRMAH